MLLIHKPGTATCMWQLTKLGPWQDTKPAIDTSEINLVGKLDAEVKQLAVIVRGRLSEKNLHFSLILL